MTIASQLRKSEELFQFANNIVGVLSEHYNLQRDEAWTVLSPNRTVEALQKHFKKEKKKNDPLRQIKNARTAFSFFTRDQRPRIHEQNPNATFGELSRLVSAEWNKLSETQKKKYKSLEVEDKARFQKEKTELMDRLAAEAARATTSTTEETPAVETSEPTPAPTTSKSTKSKGKKAKGKSTPETVETTPAPTPSTSKSTKSKGKKAKGKSSRPAASQSVTA